MRNVNLLVLLVLVANGLYATVVFPKPLYRAYLNLVQGKPHVGERFTLRLSLKALADAPQTKIEWHFGNGHINLLSAGHIDTVSINGGDSVYYDYDLRIDKIGAYALAVEISSLDTTQKDLWSAVANYYITVYYDTIFFADTTLGDLPYNIEIPDSLIELMMESLEKYGGTLPRWTVPVRMRGTVRYRDNDINTDVPVPRIKMVLNKGFVWLGELVAEWYTDENGYYDKTFSLAPNIYTLFVQSETPDAKAFGFSLPPVWVFDPVDQFVVVFGHTREFNPTITSGNKIVEMLLNVRKVKEWAYGNFGITRGFTTIVYPAPSYIPTPSYCPTVYWAPATWAKLSFGDKIYIGGSENLWGRYGMQVIAHEWGHAFYYGTLFNHVIPSGVTDFTEHNLKTVSSPGFAWNEGFAEFIEYACVLEHFPYHTGISKIIEDFYGGGNHPYYKGEEPISNPNPDGRKVEGAVMQFLYDLWDSKTTPDNYPNWAPYTTPPHDFDDENINAPLKIRQTWQRMAVDVLNSYGWSYYDYWWGILGVYYKSTWALGIEDFKNYWDALNFPNITELYNVIIHPFNYVPQYDLPVPYNVQATIVDQSIKLTWSENTLNEGGFWIRRKRDNEEWQNYYALIKNPNQMYCYDYNISECIYKYKLSAITADTSESSIEVTIQGPPNTPSGLTIVSQPTLTSVTIRWIDNSAIESGFKIARRVGDGAWNDNYQTLGANATQYTDTVSFLRKYSYKVRAYDNQGNYSAWSNEVEFSSGVLAQSGYPLMSAYNAQPKVAIGPDRRIHIIYYDGQDVYHSLSSNGYNFSPWKEITIYASRADTIPALTISRAGMPHIIWGQCIPTSGGHRVAYYVRDTLHWPPDLIYRSEVTTAQPYPPSFTWVNDTGWVAFRKLESHDQVIIARYPPMFHHEIQTPFSFICNPIIGYDKAGRLVVLVREAQYGALRLYYRRIGTSQWHSLEIPNLYALGAPALWTGHNELRISFEGQNIRTQQEGLFFLRIPWQNNTYNVNLPLELVSSNCDFDGYGIEGYSYLASQDVVLWKYNNDIYYSQRQGGVWTTPVNIAQSSDISSYPQGIVFGSALYPRLFALWTEKVGSNYYLVRKIINLPPPYQNVQTIAQVDNSEATGYNNTRRLLRDTEGRLHLTFTSGDSVYHTYFQNNAWTEPVYIGTGKYPALASGPEGKIYCLWAYNQGYPDFLEQLCFSRFDGINWTTPTALLHTYNSFF